MKKFIILILLLCNRSYTQNAVPSAQEFEQQAYKWMRTFSEALHVLRTKYYVKNVDISDAMIKSIKSLISIVPHCDFLDPKAYESILRTTSGEFYGIGVIIGSKNVEDAFIVIIDVLPGNPADQAGIKAGDKIIEIEGKSLTSMSADEIAALLKGERHSIVHVTVERANYPEPLSFKIKRDVIKDANALCYYIKDYNVYYFSLVLFTQQAAKQISQVLKKAEQTNARAIILDLRNNSGGLLSAAIDIVSLFVPQGSPVVTTRDRDGNTVEQYTTQKPPVTNSTIPIFVLVNNYTASASEILAGCLRLYANKLQRLVFIVGSTTFGKGSVQEVIPASNDCAFKITTALYFLPDNTTIQGIGIIPDITINPRVAPSEHTQWINKHFGHEKSLKNYIQPDGKKSTEATETKKNKPWKEQRRETVMQDYLIQNTLTLINLLDLIQKAYPQAKVDRSLCVQKYNEMIALDKDAQWQEVGL